jgi:rubrerythrin
MRTPQNVYRRCVEFEEKAAAIYLRLAARFSPENKELSSLWLEMGMQEKEHAGLLQF